MPNQSNTRKPTNPWPNRVPIPTIIDRRKKHDSLAFLGVQGDGLLLLWLRFFAPWQSLP